MSFEFLKSPIHLIGYPVAVFIAFAVTYLLCDNLLRDQDKLTIIGSACAVTIAVSGLLFVLDRALDRKSGRENSSGNNNENDSS